MKITRGRLEKIIREETAAFVEALTDKEKRELNTKRKREKRKQDDMRYGGEDIRKLSVGIVGEDNNYFDEDGHFTSKKDAKTFSNYFTKGIQKRVRKNLKGPTPHPDDSGRGRTRSGQGRYKVDGTKKFEDVSKRIGEGPYLSMSMTELSELVDDCILNFIDEVGSGLVVDEVKKEDDKIDWAKACSRRGYKSFEQVLSAMDKLVRSSKGELLSKPK